MGWFTRSNKVKKKPTNPQFNQSSPNLLGPPNVYTSSPPPKPQHHQPQPRPQPQPQSRTRRPQPPSAPAQHHASPSQHFQPAGYLPAPPGWTPGQQPHQPSVIVNQHYYLNAPPPPLGTDGHGLYSLGRLTHSMADLARDALPLADDTLAAWHGAVSAYDQICARFDDVMTLIDRESLTGTEKNLFSCQTAAPPRDADRGGAGKSNKSGGEKDRPKGSANVATSVVTGTYFSKVELYGNSKLPLDLPPLALYIPTWPLLCLAAQYSQRVYSSPRGAERDTHVPGTFLPGGRKAMVIKSVPMDHMHTIVFAVRGTASFMDWAVNLNTAPTSPAGFLDDPGNLCHAGFLSVARKMVGPVAERLRGLLRENPGRARYSLLITGHSAGGAVAALLYSHMLSVAPDAQSELRLLTERFKRVHCVTFGTPPVSLLPLLKPERPALKKSLFLSFVNEGDPVVRADKAYVKSLLELLASPPPKAVAASKPREKKSSSDPRKPKSKTSLRAMVSEAVLSTASRPIWPVPPCALSNAGRLVILRSGTPHAPPTDRKTVRERLGEGVVAATCAEEQLRGVIWGDPVAHLMSLYAGRVEVLAVGAVTAKGHR